LGIYGACVKIAMIMTLITQAFRYAYEPFVFNKSKDKDSKDTYASAMKYFIVFTLFAFLIVMANMDILKRLIIAPDYWSGLRVTPIVMVAGILLGIYFNLSLWYKLVDKTIYGMWFSLAGCGALIAVNVIFIPQYSYMACAWGGVVGYGIATLLSYFVGQKYYPINYPLKSIAKYVVLTAVLYLIIIGVPDSLPLLAKVASKSVVLVIYLIYALKFDMHLSLKKTFPYLKK
jgi:O-antigen/teichoic acid export membrane protein